VKKKKKVETGTGNREGCSLCDPAKGRGEEKDKDSFIALAVGGGHGQHHVTISWSGQGFPKKEKTRRPCRRGGRGGSSHPLYREKGKKSLNRRDHVCEGKRSASL